MNRSAKQHLDKAATYVAKGEEFYRKAAEEIVAAKEADPTLSNREIGERFNKGAEWVRRMVLWIASGSPASSPHELMGESETARKDASGAKKVLREAPPEQLAEMIREADVERGLEISRALNKASLKRQTEKERRSDEKERELLGDETVEGLKFTEAVQEIGWYLIKTNQDLASFLKRANELGIENVPDRFRDRWTDSLAAAEDKLGMAKALLQADEIDWTAFEDMLGKEV